MNVSDQEERTDAVRRHLSCVKVGKQELSLLDIIYHSLHMLQVGREEEQQVILIVSLMGIRVSSVDGQVS